MHNFAPMKTEKTSLEIIPFLPPSTDINGPDERQDQKDSIHSRHCSIGGICGHSLCD